MIQEIIKKWDENKHKLEEYFRTTEQEQYYSYELIVKKLFELVINDDRYSYLTDNMTVIDDGEYQGVQIFVIPRCHCPDVKDYLITDTYYGSCSGCDTLLGIAEYDDGLPSEQQVKEYMMLALHLVQKLRRLPEGD